MLGKEDFKKHFRSVGLATVLAAGGVFGAAPVVADQFEQVAHRTYIPSGHFEGFYEIALDNQTSFLMEPSLASDRIEIAKIESFENFGSLAGKKIIRYSNGNTVASLPNSKGETSGAYLMFEVQALGKTIEVFFPTFIDPRISHSQYLHTMAYTGQARGEITVE